MSALTSPVLINPNRAYWLSSIANDVIHSTITTQEIDANLARFSTVYVSDQLTTSSLNASSFSLKSLDLSEGYVSTLFTNNIYTSSQTWASDLSGGLGFVRVQTDPSGVRVSGDPIVFGDLVYFTSTITLVPVSTIVNTDIFAQNGYFSTLSSGSISAGQIQANTASLSTLTVSSITTTDISGFEPSTWSLYPTLNSSITFNGSNVLSNIGNKLFFAGNEITDLSGGGQDWSYFLAQTDVSMNNFSIRQLSTLQYNDGARLYSQTGNNLFYNGQQISYGNIGSAANWSFYPASTNVNMAGYGITSPNKLNLAAPQFSTVVDGGINIASLATYDITAQNGNRGQINLTANGGFNNGLFGSINLTANGATLGGVGTGGLITLTANTPVGSACNASSAIKFSAAGIDSYAGAVPPIGSLAGYNFIYGTGGVNITAGLPPVFPNIPFTTYLYGTAGVTTESTFYVPQILPYWNGITTPPDLVISGRYIVPNLAQVYLQLSNVKYLYMDSLAQIQNVNLLGFSNTTGQITGLSTINGIPLAQIQTPSNIVCSNITVAISTATNTLDANLVYTDSLNFLNGAGALLQTGTLSTTTINAIGVNTAIQNFSSIKSFNVSTQDFWCSSINGQPIDISGNPFVNINNFSTLFASSMKVSSLSGYVGDGVVGSTVMLEGGINFQGNPTTNPTGGRFLTNLRNIFSLQQNLFIQASTTTLTWSGGVNPGGIVRIGKGGAYDSYFKQGPTSEPILSTSAVYTSSLVGDPIAGMDVSGYLGVTGDLGMGGNITLTTTKGVEFGNGNVLGNGFVANTSVPCFTDGGAFGNNLGGVAANELFIGSGTGAFGAAKLYCDFPGDNFGIDIIDANGADLFETINCYDTGGFNFQTNLYGVSSIVGYTPNSPPGGAQAVGIQGILTAPQVSTATLVPNTIDFGAGTELQKNFVANTTIPCFVDGGGAGNNLGAFGANAFYIGSGTGAFGAAKLYCDFPGDNWGIDIIDANGTDLFETINCYDTGGFNFQTNVYGVSSIVGWTANTPGAQQAVGVQGILTANQVSTTAIKYTSTLNWYQSNSAYQFPLVLEHDAAGNLSTSGAAIRIIGHSFQNGAVQHELQMGWRSSDGTNYITAVWPGQGLEDLTIEGLPVTITNGVVSTIFGSNGYSVLTNQPALLGGQTIISSGVVSTPSLLVSSINGYAAGPAFTNSLMTSTMELYAASTTLMYWDSTTTSENINVSNYDAVVGINGNYKIGASFQFISGGSADEVEFFILKNDAVIPQSGGIIELQNNAELVTYVESIESLANGDKIQIGCYTANSNVFVSTIVGARISSPSVILTMYKVDS